MASFEAKVEYLDSNERSKIEAEIVVNQRQIDVLSAKNYGLKNRLKKFQKN